MIRVPEIPGLVNEWVRLLVTHRGAFSQPRVFEWISALVFAEVVGGVGYSKRGWACLVWTVQPAAPA